MNKMVKCSKNSFILFSFFLLLQGCASNSYDPEKIVNAELKNHIESYDLMDESGEYNIKKTIKKSSSGQFIISKYFVVSKNSTSNAPVEKSISVSKINSIETKKGKVYFLLPQKSRYQIWLDQKKNFVEHEILTDKGNIKTTIKSSDKDENGAIQNKIVETKFSNKNKITCFYSQVLECIKLTNFFEMSKKSKSGKVSFTLIWDSWPYINEIYNQAPNKLLTQASFAYDNQDENGNDRYVLNIPNSSLFYIIDKTSGELLKKLWISQGITQLKSGLNEIQDVSETNI